MVQNISAKQAYELVRTGKAVIIDIRDGEAFKQEHAPFAYSLPLGRALFAVDNLQLDDDIALIFKCYSGVSSVMAVQMIQEQTSLKNQMLNLEGGINAWIQHGLPVIYGVQE